MDERHADSHQGPMGCRARGFSLIELLLATALGGLVVLGATGVLGLLARTERTFEARHQRVSQLGTLHALLQETFGAIVVSDTARPTSTDGQDPLPDLSLEGVEDRETIEAILSQNVDAAGAYVRPRLIVSGDPAATPKANGSTIETFQAFELVTARPPAGYGLPERLQGEDRELIQASRLSPRGVFELRPDPRGAPRAMTLWWRPIQHDGTPFYDSVEPDRENQALRLVDGIRSLRWQIFDDGIRHERFVGTWESELPAYIELEIRTVTGLYANWMFEIGWSIGAEWVAPAPQDPNDDDDDPDDAQQPGAANAAGDAPAGPDAGRTPGARSGTERTPEAGGGR